MEKHSDIMRVLATREQVAKRVAELGKQISADYAGLRPLVVGILKGSWIFLADLVRAMDIDPEIDFMALSSYGSGTDSTGEVKINMDLDVPVSGRHIIVVEDIVDSGRTLHFMRQALEARGAESVAIAALLSKPSRREIDVKVEYIGMEIENEFVVGYGLDFNEKYRGLKDICVLKPEAYK